MPITPDMFLWTDENGKGSYYADDVAGVDLTGCTIRSGQLSNVGVRRVYQKGTSGTVKSVELKDSQSVVVITFVDDYTKTGPTDVELKLALTYKSKTVNAPEYEISFTMKNEETIVEEGQTAVSPYGRTFLGADAPARTVAFEGDGGSVYTVYQMSNGNSIIEFKNSGHKYVAYDQAGKLLSVYKKDEVFLAQQW